MKRRKLPEGVRTIDQLCELVMLQLDEHDCRRVIEMLACYEEQARETFFYMGRREVICELTRCPSKN